MSTPASTADPSVSPSVRDGTVTDPRRQRLILVAMCTALIAVVASVSGLNVAQQDLAVDLGASQGTLLWVINGYTLVLAALLLPIGAIGDRFGRKQVLIAGLALFALSSVGAALATTSTWLLIARIAAGIGAAMVMPITLSVITASFPAEQRARAVGIWAGFAGAGGILGLFFSSAMIDWFTWPWLFAMPAVLSIVALAVSVVAVANSKEDHDGPFDTIGSILSALAIGGLVLAIHEGPERGWSDALTIAGVFAGVLGTSAFLAWELRQRHPLLDVRVFRNRSLATGSVNLLLVFAVMFGLFLVLVQYLQAVLGYSALQASAGLLPMAMVLMPLSTYSPTIAARFGTRATLLTGVALFGAGLAMMAVMASVTGGYWAIAPGLLILAAGMGLAMTPSTSAITEALPTEKQGVASALNDTVRELGGALGVALLGSVLSSSYRSSISTTADQLPAGIREPVADGIGTALAAADQLGAQAPTVVSAAKEAFVDGWQTSMWVGVALAAVGFGFVAVRGERRPSAIASSTVREAQRELVTVGD